MESEVDYIMGVDIGPRNTGICVYSILLDIIVWWIWLDLQAYCVAADIEELIRRLHQFVTKYRGIFDECDIISIEGQTQTQSQRINKYLQNALYAMFPGKCVIQNSTEMGTLVRNLVPFKVFNKFEQTYKNKRTIKKKCTIYLGDAIIRGRKNEKNKLKMILKDREKFGKFVRSTKGKEALESIRNTLDSTQHVSMKRKRNKKKWRIQSKTDADDIYDALVIALLKAQKIVYEKYPHFVERIDNRFHSKNTVLDNMKTPVKNKETIFIDLSI